MRFITVVFTVVLNCISIGFSNAGNKFFFNETSMMQVTSGIIPVKTGFDFSFRTCHGGVLLYQAGSGDDYISMQVSPGTVNYNISVSPPHFTPSHMTLKWKVNGKEESIRAGNELDKNYFHTVTFNPGDSNRNATLTIKGPTTYSVIVPKSILGFQSSGPLYAGGVFSNASFAYAKGFVGCIESGDKIPLVQRASSINITPGCPLDSQIQCPKKACQAGFTGYYCETNIDECGATPCHTYSTCIDGVNTYTCNCGPRWTGPKCKTFLGSLCNTNPCQNQGVCTESIDRNNYTCTCKAPYTGRNCTIVVDPCGLSPCSNGGTCHRMAVNSTEFNCTCLTGFTGIKCETNINDCASLPCAHGKCIDGTNNFTCNCTGSGYKGLKCAEDIDECKPVSPCFHGATCRNYAGTYGCSCVRGYDGKHCENNIDNCNPNPCKNAGTCKDGVNDFNCTCLVGYNGTTCEHNIDDCVNHNCTQNQVCIDGVNGFTCNCKPGYTGSNCMVDIQECQSNPCQNNGTCNEGVNGYNCTCLSRFKGTHCELDTIDDCLSQPCMNNGTCTDGIADFNCSCLQGYSGKRCDLDICDPNPCANDGNCTKINQFDFNCTCPQGFRGHNCSINIDDCINNTCTKNATCIDGINNYTCQCPVGYRGDFCHIDINECVSNPCKNNATCANNIGHYKCKCLSGFNGTQCEINIDDCPSHGCNNGTCIDGINDYTCQCNSGYEGKHCENDTNECLDSSSCLNGATCVNTVGSHYCQCNKFTNGTRCELDIDECARNKTLCNTGFCQNKVYTGYQCYCKPGWTGDNCYENINDCILYKECKNGATCTDLIFDYWCNCTTGWKGKKCDQDIDECSLGYCKNGATCYNSVGSYNCTCVPGYTDVNCSTDIDECAGQPCENGATCSDYVNFYNCTCVPGYNGTNCTNDIDECASVPCVNGGTCIDGINEFNCNCTSNYTGNLCQYPVSRCRPTDPCLNNGTCIDQGLDNYTCNCIPGFGGQDCVNSTTISMNGSSYMAFAVGKTIFSLSLQFRTTLKYGVLAVDTDGMFLLQLKGDEIELTFNGTSYTVGKDANISNSQWHHVTVNMTTSSMHVIIDNSSCTFCSLQAPRSSQPSISQLFIGGKDGISNKWLIGCVRAVEIDEVTVIPTHSSVQLVNVIHGCPRVPVCQPDPCIHGQCIDEWVKHKCECDRPWTGNKCNTTFVAGTFGAKAPLNKEARRQRRSAEAIVNASYAKFSTDTTFSVHSKLSFFIKTRDNDGLIAFLTSEATDHVTVVLLNGSIVVQTTVSSNKNQRHLSTKINDGQYHFISISVNESKVDNTSFPGITLSSSIAMKTSYLGGLKNWAAFSKDVVIATKGFRGCVQDMRLDNKLFEFFKSPTSLDSYSLIDSSGLGQGCPGENVCSPQPCANGGNCHDNWNDYKCTCQPFYGGHNCSLFGCALVQLCGSGGQCMDVQNGQFECIYPATFNASLSHAQFKYAPNNNVTLKPQFSFKLKTRQSTAVVLAIGSGLIVRVDNRTLNVTCTVCGASGSFISDKVINNGVWHDVHLNSSDRIYLTIDGLTQSFQGSFTGQALQSLLTTLVTIGQNTLIPFKGCLDNLRVGAVLLPFKSYYNSSYNVSHVTPLKPHFEATVSGINSGCHSDDVCGLLPCVRGNCSNVWNAFKCACPVGYTGPVCNNTANMTCAHRPCFNNATCYNNVTAHIDSNDDDVSDFGKDRFVCQCPPGFKGRQCKDVTDECSPSPCLNGGNCTDRHLNFTCHCVVGYTGRRCEIDIDDCVNNNCTNNATCVDGVNEYTCNCTEGFNGTHCGTDIDECTAGVCASTGTKNCTNTIGSYQCICNEGYYGRNCPYNASQWCSVGRPCIHGNCSANSTGFHCACHLGWEGRTCSVDIRECDSHPCNNNGTCVDSHSQKRFFPGYECRCNVDWTGQNCNSYVSPCNATPCANNATCTRITYNKYKCNCTEGYGNMNCSGLTKFCQPNRCENGGSCVPLKDGFSCNCKAGYIGKTCAKLRCDASPCRNGGTCEQTSSDYKCSCTSAYNGANCEKPIDFCKDNENCLHLSVCVSMSKYANYTCNCTEEYTGTHCDVVKSIKPQARGSDKRESLIIGVVVACVLLILMVIIIVVFCKKRSGNGTYSPSKQEMDGGRVELNSVLKPPNQERLI